MGRSGLVLIWVLAAAAASGATACSEDGSPASALNQQGSGGASAGSGGSVSGSGGDGTDSGGSTEPPGPDQHCMVPDVDSTVTRIAVDPDPLTTTDAPIVRVSDSVTGHTNVTVRLCTPAGPVTPSFGGVDSAAAPFAWHWDAPALPAGTTQVIFQADPSATTYRTLRIDVAEGSGADGGSSDAAADGSAGPPSFGLCDNPQGNILAHAGFEEGMSGLAPAFWQVRNPDMPNGACLASGTPDSHVFLSDGPPGCGGNAVSVDAHGQWDCYAIQLFSEYGTIEGGKTYRISAAARSTGNAPSGGGTICPECAAAWFHLGAQWLDASDAVFGDIKNPKPATAELNDYDWKLLWWDVAAPPQARRIVVWLSAHYPGKVEFDNVAVVELD